MLQVTDGDEAAGVVAAPDGGLPVIVFEPFGSGYGPGDPVDRAIIATRNAVFPWNGLMPVRPAPR